jgi:hypothetical protein
MVNNIPPPDSAPPDLAFVRLDEIARLADLAASYWRSIMLASDRVDPLTVAVHLKQVAAVIKSAFAVAAELGGSGRS